MDIGEDQTDEPIGATRSAEAIDVGRKSVWDLVKTLIRLGMKNILVNSDGKKYAKCCHCLNRFQYLL